MSLLESEEAKNEDSLMQIEAARETAKHWCDAWNRRDLDAIMTHYAEDAEFSSPTIVKRWGVADGWLRGKDKLRENFAVGVQAPGLRFDLVDVVTGVNAMCIIYRRESGAIVTDTIELDADGKAKQIIACYGGPVSPYKVMVDDNFNYMDEDDRSEYGTFSTAEEALDACRQLVDEALLAQYREGETADQLFERYTSFGQDPFVVASWGAANIEFSAWTYARGRARELAAPGAEGLQQRRNILARKSALGER
jgi:ketosteroid isomerase-like protein